MVGAGTEDGLDFLAGGYGLFFFVSFFKPLFEVFGDGEFLVADHFCESGGIEGGVGGDSEGGFCGRARGPGQLVIWDVGEVSEEHFHGVDGVSLGGLDDGHG